MRLLFIEPKNLPTGEPVIDELTMRMAAALRKPKEPDDFKFDFQLGTHTCVCGAMSEAQDVILANGWTTNTLCVHYLAYHRSEVPEADLEMVRALPSEVESPDTWELHGAECCDSGSWAGRRPSLGGYVTGTGATRGVPAAGGR